MISMENWATQAVEKLDGEKKAVAGNAEMKVIPKNLLDDLIREHGLYYFKDERESLDKMTDIGMEIEAKCGVDWIRAENLIDAIAGPSGFMPQAPNEVIYEVLKVLGWEVG